MKKSALGWLVAFIMGILLVVGGCSSYASSPSPYPGSSSENYGPKPTYYLDQIHGGQCWYTANWGSCTNVPTPGR